MPRGPAHPPEVRAEAVRLRDDEGLSARSISEQLHVPQPAVAAWLRRAAPSPKPRKRGNAQVQGGGQYSDEARVECVRRNAEGQTDGEIAAALHMQKRAVARWTERNGLPQLQVRSRERLAELLYDTVVETLLSLAARARATADVAWIEKQSAADLAEFDAVQWEWAARIISAFRPTEPEPEPEGGTTIDVGSEPELHRNGAVDPAV